MFLPCFALAFCFRCIVFLMDMGVCVCVSFWLLQDVRSDQIIVNVVFNLIFFIGIIYSWIHFLINHWHRVKIEKIPTMCADPIQVASVFELIFSFSNSSLFWIFCGSLRNDIGMFVYRRFFLTHKVQGEFSRRMDC